jgi:hypothetical protein
MIMTLEEIEVEFDKFFEFDTENRDFVTSTSCKLFARYLLEKQNQKDQQAEPASKPKDGPTCNYPECTCPFDAPADPNWCARGYPKQAKGVINGRA